MVQLITPKPNIACKPGWCLQYVREAFGIEKGVYPTASSGWDNAEHKHTDKEFPDAWVPLWFSMEGVPAGHVVLRSPSGKVWSTTNAGQYTPRIHPSLDDLMAVYERAGLSLTYLGWSEDIESIRIWENEEMDAELKRKIEAIYDAIFNGGTSMPDGKPLKDLIQDNFSTVKASLSRIEEKP